MTLRNKLISQLMSAAILIFLVHCTNKNSYIIKERELMIQPEVDSLLATFSKDFNLEDSVSIFVVLKNIDAITAKIYLIAKKAIRSDFDLIGTPVTSYKRNGINFYFYTGMEKILHQDTAFWSVHPEIYDDRSKQREGLFESLNLKKELYLIENEKIQKVDSIDDLIFVSLPKDTISFY
ncbi:MAG: hypothetical protein R3A50_16715 [Saprospiraceae bacterium]